MSPNHGGTLKNIGDTPITPSGEKSPVPLFHNVIARLDRAIQRVNHESPPYKLNAIDRRFRLEVPLLEIQRHVHQADKHRDFDKRADDRGKGHPRADAEDRHRYGDSQLEVVAGSGEGDGSRLLVRCADALAHVERDEEHDDKVDQQRGRDAQHIEGGIDYGLAAKREHHNNGEQQGYKRDRAYLFNELIIVPVAALLLKQEISREHAAKERDAQVDENALGDLADGNRDSGALKPEPSRHHGDKDVGVYGVEQYLEYRVEGHEPRGVLRISFRQVVPYDNHGDAARQPHHDEAGHVFRVVPYHSQKQDCQEEHQYRPDDPVLHKRKHEHAPVAEDLAQLLVFHLGQRRVHH